MFILALDQGTTSCRAILFDHAGVPVSVAQKEFRQIFPQPGWVEHDANEIWATQAGVIAEVMAITGVTRKQIAGIGITNQRETTVLWDRATGEPLAPAIVWQDRRTAGDCDRMRGAGAERLIQQKTGLVIDAYFSGTKLRWLLDHVPGARSRAEKGELAFGTIDSWLIWKLTGGKLHLTDATNASRTMLFNIHRNSWDEELLALLDIPAAVLPEVRSSSEIYGEAVLSAVEGVPIAGVAGDQQAALFGQGCTHVGMAKNTYGTGCFLLLHTGAVAVSSRRQLLSTAAARRKGEPAQFALEGSVFIAGAVVQWLRDGLGIIRHSSEIEELAARVPDSGGVFFVPAFAGLGAPHWDPYARGTITGLTRGSTAAHLARAALDSIAFQTADVLDAMHDDTAIRLQEMRVDGGAVCNNALLQFQADVIGVPVIRPSITETTALGAAYLAGLAVGFWKSQEEIASQWKVDRRFEPKMDPDARAELLSQWRTAVERAKGQVSP